ncbi:MAG: hypothetical protein LBQ02_04065 [Candidatus Nomurabacteria bacterium]|jgi:hypothetical protein|nr:hypothetical protein [Candidatus Nomurabacteria bacterium]
MLNKILGCVGVVSVVVLLVILNTTTPSSAGPLGMLVVFSTIYLILLVLFSLLLQLLSKLIMKIRHKPNNMAPIGPKKAYYAASILAFAPLVILVSESFGGGIVGPAAAVILAIAAGIFMIKK